MNDMLNAMIRSFSLWIVLVGLWFVFLTPTVMLTLYAELAQASIQAAIDQIASNPRIDGGTVELPAGWIEIKTPLQIRAGGPELTMGLLFGLGILELAAKRPRAAYLKSVLVIFLLATPALAGMPECGKGAVALTVRRMACADVQVRIENLWMGDDASKLPERREEMTALGDGSYRMAETCEKDGRVTFERWSDWPGCKDARYLGPLELSVTKCSGYSCYGTLNDLTVPVDQ